MTRGWDDATTAAALEQVRELALALPEVNERTSHGAPAFYVRDKKQFVHFWDDHHGDGHLAIWCAAAPGVQEALIAEDPERFFRPAYVGSRGWVGVELTGAPDWDQVGIVIEDAFRKAAPKTLVARLDAD